jgi:TP901 family phage tail tape measure protein
MATDTLGSISGKLLLDIRDFQAKLELASKQTQNFVNTTTKGVGDVQKTWKQSLSGIGDNLTKFGRTASLALTVPLTIFAKKALSAATEYDETMNIIRVASGEGEEAIRTLTPTIEEFGTKGRFSLTQVANAVKDMVKDGLTPAEIAMGQLEAAYNMATATGEDLYESQRVLSTTMAAYGAEVQDAARFSDVLTGALNSSQLELEDLSHSIQYIAPVASNLGMTIEELGGVIAQLGDFGIKGSIAGTTLRRAMINLAAPTKRAREAMDDLGVSAFDSSGKMKSWEEIIHDFNEALYQEGEALSYVGGRTKQQEDELDRLTSKYQSAAQKIADYEDGLMGVNLTDEKRNEKIKEQATIMENLSGKIGELNGIQGTAVTVTRKLTDEQRQAYLNNVFGAYAVSGMTALIKDGTEGYLDYADSVGKVGIAQEQAEEASKGLYFEVERFKSLLQLLLQDIGDRFEPIVKKAADVVGKLGDGFKSLDPKIQDSVIAFGFFLAIIGPVAMAIGGLAKILAGEGILGKGLMLLASGIKSVFIALATFLGISVSTLLIYIGVIIAALGVLYLAWKNNWLGIRDIVQSVIKNIQNWLGTALPNWLEAHADFIASLVNFLVAFVNFMTGFFLTNIGNIMQSFIKITALAISIAIRIWATLVSKIGSFLQTIFSNNKVMWTEVAKLIGLTLFHVGKMVESFVNILAALLNGDVKSVLKNTLTLFWNLGAALLNLFTALGGAILGVVVTAINKVLDVINKLFESELIKKGLEKLGIKETKLEIPMPGGGGGGGGWSSALGFGIGLLDEVADELDDTAVKAEEFASDIEESIGNAIDTLSDIDFNQFMEDANAAADSVLAFADGLVGAIDSLKSFQIAFDVDTFTESIYGVADSLREKFTSVGELIEDVDTTNLENAIDLINNPSLASVGITESADQVLASSIPTTSSNITVNIGMYAGSEIEKRQIAKELYNALSDYNLMEGMV